MRLKAIDALASIGVADNGVLAALIALLTNENKSVRTHAVNSLARFGSKARSAVPVLKDIREQQGISKYFRRDVENAIKSIEAGETAQYLKE